MQQTLLLIVTLAAMSASLVLSACGDDSEPSPAEGEGEGEGEGEVGPEVRESEVVYVRDAGASTLFEAIDFENTERRIIFDAAGFSDVAPRGFSVAEDGLSLYFDAIGTDGQGIYTADVESGKPTLVYADPEGRTIRTARVRQRHVVFVAGEPGDVAAGFASSGLYSYSFDFESVETIAVPMDSCTVLADPTVSESDAIYFLRLGCTETADAGLFAWAGTTALPILTFVTGEPTDMMSGPEAKWDSIYVAVRGSFDSTGDGEADLVGQGLVEYDFFSSSAVGIFGLDDESRLIVGSVPVLPDLVVLDVDDGGSRTLLRAGLSSEGGAATTLTSGGGARNPAMR